MNSQPIQTKTIKGRFNGKTVVLEEPAPVSEAVAVTVKFPIFQHKPRSVRRVFHWAVSSPKEDGFDGSVADELIQQRQAE